MIKIHCPKIFKDYNNKRKSEPPGCHLHEGGETVELWCFTFLVVSVGVAPLLEKSGISQMFLSYLNFIYLHTRGLCRQYLLGSLLGWVVLYSSAPSQLDSLSWLMCLLEEESGL